MGVGKGLPRQLYSHVENCEKAQITLIVAGQMFLIAVYDKVQEMKPTENRTQGKIAQRT